MSQARRRQFLVAAGAFLAAPLTRAQHAPRIYRIGFLGDTSPPPKGRGARESLHKGLHDRGWIEGRNVAFEYRWAEGKSERYPEMAREFIRLKVDVIIAPSEDGALAAKAATRTIPIVTIYPLDPIRLGLIESYARPGGNVTGLTYEAGSQTTIGKHLDLLGQAVPGLSRVAVLWNPASPQSERWLKEMQAPARALRMEILPFAVRTPEEFGPEFARMSEDRAGALMIMADPMFFSHRPQLAELAVRHRLPTFSVLYAFPERGGLMTYQVDIPDLFARAAVYVDKILRGANPAELPVEQPTKFELVVNLKTAKALGIKIPQSILLRADRVIE
jgi:putative tryptophan/tyrosine transport system substrate-binding protein